MNRTYMKARITDQHLTLVNVPLIASGGVDEVKIRFEFCNLWEGCGKTAVFYRDPETVYHVPIADGLAMVPREVLTEEGHFYLGVMGSADNIRTTEVVRVYVAQGAITEATNVPAEPTPDIYQQILAAYGSLETALQNERGRVIESNDGEAVTFWVGTQAEYDAIESKVVNCVYIITDATTPTDIEQKLKQLTEYQVGDELTLSTRQVAYTIGRPHGKSVSVFIPLSKKVAANGVAVLSAEVLLKPYVVTGSYLVQSAFDMLEEKDGVTVEYAVLCDNGIELWLTLPDRTGNRQSELWDATVVAKIRLE